MSIALDLLTKEIVKAEDRLQDEQEATNSARRHLDECEEEEDQAREWLEKLKAERAALVTGKQQAL